MGASTGIANLPSPGQTALAALALAALALAGVVSCRSVPEDPWVHVSRRGYEPPSACPRQELIPTCPPDTEGGIALDGQLRKLDGQEVAVSGVPMVAGFSTMLACPGSCCNHVTSQILLCGSEESPWGGCAVSVAIGGCQGDDCSECCSHNVEERELVARGRLRYLSGAVPGGLLLEGADTLPYDQFMLEEQSLCYR